MQEEVVKVKVVRQEMDKAKATMVSLRRGLQTSDLLFNALAPKKLQLKAGKNTLNFLSHLMVYSS